MYNGHPYFPKNVKGAPRETPQHLPKSFWPLHLSEEMASREVSLGLRVEDTPAVWLGVQSCLFITRESRRQVDHWQPSALTYPGTA